MRKVGGGAGHFQDGGGVLIARGEADYAACCLREGAGLSQAVAAASAGKTRQRLIGKGTQVLVVACEAAARMKVKGEITAQLAPIGRNVYTGVLPKHEQVFREWRPRECPAFSLKLSRQAAVEGKEGERFTNQAKTPCACRERSNFCGELAQGFGIGNILRRQLGTGLWRGAEQKICCKQGAEKAFWFGQRLRQGFKLRCHQRHMTEAAARKHSADCPGILPVGLGALGAWHEHLKRPGFSFGGGQSGAEKHGVGEVFLACGFTAT